MKKSLFALLILSLNITACRDDAPEADQSFDRPAMLRNYADALIIPAFQELNLRVEALEEALRQLNQNTASTELAAAQNAWREAYGAWTYASVYNLGPAAESGLRKSLLEEIATFPVSRSKIDTILARGQYNFQDFNRDARGFLALEYLLFGGPAVDNATVLQLLQNQATRSEYLLACSQDIQSRVATVLRAWQGPYRAEFLSQTGSDVGSSSSLLYNEFVKSFERIKNFKIELPLGMRPGQSQAEPELVEAYYSGASLDFLALHLEAIENIYYGRDCQGQKGIGFVDYLESVVGGPELISATEAQWEAVQDRFGAIPRQQPLSYQVLNQPQPVDDFRLELQKHTRFFKSDMSSRLGLAITFSSGDGD